MTPTEYLTTCTPDSLPFSLTLEYRTHCPVRNQFWKFTKITNDGSKYWFVGVRAKNRDEAIKLLAKIREVKDAIKNI